MNVLIQALNFQTIVRSKLALAGGSKSEKQFLCFLFPSNLHHPEINKILYSTVSSSLPRGTGSCAWPCFAFAFNRLQDFLFSSFDSFKASIIIFKSSIMKFHNCFKIGCQNQYSILVLSSLFYAFNLL